MKLKERYNLNKSASVGTELICPSCGSHFVKTNYQQAFCKTKPKTKCKDFYWNNVTPSKRNNVTRISPKNAAWRKRCLSDEYPNNGFYEDHPFSCDSLGQWID